MFFFGAGGLKMIIRSKQVNPLSSHVGPPDRTEAPPVAASGLGTQATKITKKRFNSCSIVNRIMNRIGENDIERHHLNESPKSRFVFLCS